MIYGIKKHMLAKINLLLEFFNFQDELLYEMPNSLRELIQILEKESKKLIKTGWFAKLNENMLPKHTLL